jgi:predicted NBD/HSP70 family sugar kinase
MTELVSAKGIVRRAIEALRAARKTAARRQLLERADDLSLADLAAAADRDRLVRDLLEQVGQDLGLIAANLANLFAPETILLAGEVPTCCPLVRETLEEWFRRHTLPEILQEIVLADGSLSAFAGAMGAAYLGFFKTFPEEEIQPAAVRSPLLAAGP